MDWLSSEVVSIVYYLAPGFLAAWIFYGLTAHPKASPFERVIQALIFTVIIQVLLIVQQWVFEGIGTIAVALGPWTEQSGLVWSVVLAVVMGLAFSWCANNNFPHSRLHKSDMCVRTTFPSQWNMIFDQERRWVVLHLKGGRRLHGWPEWWPDEPDTGHFAIDQPKWLLDGGEILDLPGVEKTLVPATDVEMVEFLKYEEEMSLNPTDADKPRDKPTQSDEKEHKHGS